MYECIIDEILGRIQTPLVKITPSCSVLIFGITCEVYFVCFACPCSCSLFQKVIFYFALGFVLSLTKLVLLPWPNTSLLCMLSSSLIAILISAILIILITLILLILFCYWYVCVMERFSKYSLILLNFFRLGSLLQVNDCRMCSKNRFASSRTVIVL